MTEKTTTALLIDSPLTPFSTPEQIRAWIKELDALEAEVVPGSPAAATVADQRADAQELLDEALKPEP